VQEICTAHKVEVAQGSRSGNQKKGRHPFEMLPWSLLLPCSLRSERSIGCLLLSLIGPLSLLIEQSS